jgi:hypothetical protein
MTLGGKTVERKSYPERGKTVLLSYYCWATRAFGDEQL